MSSRSDSSRVVGLRAAASNDCLAAYRTVQATHWSESVVTGGVYKQGGARNVVIYFTSDRCKCGH